GQPVDELATLLTRKNRPFAFVTGYGREALPAGFRGAVVLGKPFGADQLLAAVGVLLYQPASVVQVRGKKDSTDKAHCGPGDGSRISSSAGCSRPWRASPSLRDRRGRTVRIARRSSVAAGRRASPVFPESPACPGPFGSRRAAC